jgi:hypothetical protein
MSYAKGDLVRVTSFGETTDATVTLVSPNGRSLMLGFEGAYMMTMPVLQGPDGLYRDLVSDHVLDIQPGDSARKAGAE